MCACMTTRSYESCNIVLEQAAKETWAIHELNGGCNTTLHQATKGHLRGSSSLSVTWLNNVRGHCMKHS